MPGPGTRPISAQPWPQAGGIRANPDSGQDACAQHCGKMKPLPLRPPASADAGPWYSAGWRRECTGGGRLALSGSGAAAENAIAGAQLGAEGLSVVLAAASYGRDDA